MPHSPQLLVQGERLEGCPEIAHADPCHQTDFHVCICFAGCLLCMVPCGLPRAASLCRPCLTLRFADVLPLTSGLFALMLRHRPCMGLHGTSSCNGNASGGWRRLSPVFPRVQFVPCKGSTFILYGKIFAIQLVACRFGFLWGLVCKHGEHGRRLSVLIVFQQCQKPVLLPVPFFADLKMSCGLGEFCAAWVCMRKALALRGLQAGRPCVCNGAGL